MAHAIYINCFEVPVGRDEEFLAMWREVNRYMREQPGFVSYRLHRATRGDVPYRFINYVLWESADALHAAHDEGFHALVSRPEWASFRHAASTFDVVSESPTDGTR